MVEIHAASFSQNWSVQDFETHLAMPSDDVIGIEKQGKLLGFIIIRTVEDQAEILTIVVTADSKKKGLGAQLLQNAEERLLKRGVEIVFLEVAVDNIAALGLYKKHGYQQCGKRPGYYRREIDGKIGRVDAILYQKHLA